MTERFQPPSDRRPERASYARVRPVARRSPWVMVGYGALGLACALLAAVTFLLVAAPVDLLRDHIVREVKAQTGRDLVVAGPVSLSLVPRLGIALRDVSLSPPPGMKGPPTLLSQSVDVELRAGALLSRQVSVQRVVLNRPVITLQVDAQGRRSWDFASLDTRPIRLAQAGANDGPRLPTRRSAASTERIMATVAALLPTDVRIANGSVRYVDERTGAIEEVRGLDVDLAVGEIAGPLTVTGNLTWRGEKVALEASLSPFSAVLQERPARLVFKANAPSLQASYNGSAAATSTGLALDGNVSLNAASIAALSAWIGAPLPDREAGALAVNGRMTASGDRIALSDLSATVGETSARGSLALDARGGTRPYLSGALQVAELDLGKLLLRTAGTPAEGPAVRGGQRQGDPITDLLRRGGASPPSAPQVRGFAKRAGSGRDWSDDVIDVGLLGLGDADLKLQADRLIYREFKTGAGRISLSLKERVGRLTLEEVQLYGGRGHGVVTLDAMGETAAQSINLTLEGISAGPLLKDALGFEWLDGRAGIVLALAGQGLSERQMVESLNGTVNLKTVNGTISGLDLPKLVHGIEQGRLPSLEISPAEKTPFSELAGTFVIANGIARNQDLRLISQNARLTGTGTADLPRRQVDYTLNAKLSGSGRPPGEGTVVNFSNIEIPVRVEGPWDKPTFSIKGQEQLTDTIKQIGKNLKSQEVQDAIKGLLRGDGEGRVKPRDLLDKLLKKE